MALPGAAALHDASPELRKINVVRISVPVGEEETYRTRLAADPDVLFVELDYRVTASLVPDDPRWPEQYGPVNVGAPAAWDVTTGSSDVILAILDSGLDTGHPEFSGRLVGGYDFVEGDAVPQDECGHGTHVTGIAAASGNNARGVAGIDWQARIMPVRVLDSVCDGWISDVVSGLIWAADSGAKVINMSLGSYGASTLLENGTYYAYSKGAALFASTGNDSYSFLAYPAAYPWVMAVGAVNRLNVRATFSNITNVDNDLMVMAPGVGILSTTPRSRFYYQFVYGTGLTYGSLDGTSMASPHAAGAAALLAGQAVFDRPDRIYQALSRTALDLSSAGWDRATGYGLIQIDRALAFRDFDDTPPAAPSEYEYDYVTSQDCPSVVYEWVDTIKHVKPLPATGKDGWAVVNFSFPFTFAGQDYTRLYVAANGYLTFVPFSAFAVSEKNNFLIPGIAPPNQMIAPFWDNLNPNAGGDIYAYDMGDRLVIEWHQIPVEGFTRTESQLTFEVILFAGTNEILFQYQQLDGAAANGASATVGLEWDNGTAGVQYSYQQPGMLKEKLAILFSPALAGETRTVRGCKFVTQNDFMGCNQLDPFGVDLFDSLIPPPPPATTLTIQRLQAAPRHNGKFLALNHYARYSLDPDPAQPYTPPPFVCYTYNLADVLKAGGHAENMFLAMYDENNRGWVRLPTVVDASAERLVAPASFFSILGVFALQPSNLPVTGASWPAVGVGLLGLALLLLCGYVCRHGR